MKQDEQQYVTVHTVYTLCLSDCVEMRKSEKWKGPLCLVVFTGRCCTLIRTVLMARTACIGATVATVSVICSTGTRHEECVCTVRTLC